MRLIPAQFVKPFLKSNKNDFLDAEAIAEAVGRQNMRFVPIKTDDQLDLQALHRVRDRLVQRRTAVINQIRGFLLERGITFAQGPANLRRNMPSLLEDAEQNLTPRMRRLLASLWQEWKQLDDDVERVSGDIEPDRRARSRLPALARDSRNRAAGLHRHGSGDRQRIGLPPRDASSPPGSALFPNNTPPAASPDCSASANEATPTCGACSSTARVPCC